MSVLPLIRFGDSLGIPIQFFVCVDEGPPQMSNASQA